MSETARRDRSTEHVAFALMVQLARVNGVVCRGERAVLMRYSTALDVSRGQAQALVRRNGRSAVAADELSALRESPAERTRVMKMMMRIAFADGRISAREMRLLRQVADRLGIAKVEFADLLVDVGHSTETRRRVWLSKGIGVGAALLAIVLVWLVWDDLEAKFDEGVRAQAIVVEQLREEMDRSLRTDPEEAARRVAESRRAAEQRELRLRTNLRRLEAQVAEEESTSLSEEILALKEQIAELHERELAFRRIEQRHRDEVLLIYARYRMRRGDETRKLSVTGTGFFVTPMGHVATNKHVVESWKFSPEAAALRREGFVVDPDSTLIAAWPCGVTVLNPNGSLKLDTSFNTKSRSLHVAATTPDRFEQRTARDRSGRSVTERLHVLDDSDLALLHIQVGEPVDAPALASRVERPQTLDKVMLLGFPTGLGALEGDRALSSPSLGIVRKIERSIQVTAPIVGGNSGGPLFAVDGSVVGVAFKQLGGPVLGACIPADRVVALLPSADVLRASARDYAASGRSLAAEQCRRLATIR